jgi:hypothetical protein
VNIAQEDQFSAAARDAHRVLLDYAAAKESRVLIQPGPVIRRLAEEFLQSLQRQVMVCPHVNPSSPMPVYARAHEPGVLRCASCLGSAARAAQGTEEDYRCDGCRSLSPDAMHEGATMLGPVTLTLGLCPGCLRLERPA